jgi:hypothetical protein
MSSYEASVRKQYGDKFKASYDYVSKDHTKHDLVLTVLELMAISDPNWFKKGHEAEEGDEYL